MWSPVCRCCFRPFPFPPSGQSKFFDSSFPDSVVSEATKDHGWAPVGPGRRDKESYEQGRPSRHKTNLCVSPRVPEAELIGSRAGFSARTGTFFRNTPFCNLPPPPVALLSAFYLQLLLGPWEPGFAVPNTSPESHQRSTPSGFPGAEDFFSFFPGIPLSINLSASG